MAHDPKIPPTILNQPKVNNPGAYKAIQKLVGAYSEDSSEDAYMHDPNSVEYYQALKDYFYRHREMDATAGGWEKGWKFCTDEYNRGRLIDERCMEIEEVRPARCYSIVTTTESMVISNRPRFFVKGFTSDEEEQRGPVLETAVNNEWQQDSRLKQETKLCVRDCSKLGIGVMLSSFETLDEYDPKAHREEAIAAKADSAGDPVAAAAEGIAEAMVAEIEVQAETPELTTTLEQDDRVVRGRVVSRRVDPWDLLIDPTATCEEDVKWIGRRITADLNAVKADPLMKNTKGLAASVREYMNKEKHKKIEETAREDAGSPYELVDLFEVFMKKPDGSWCMKVFAEGHMKFLREVDMPYWIGNPYRILTWNEDGHQLIPQSDIQIAAGEIMAERHMLTRVMDGYAREQLDMIFYSDELGLKEEHIEAAQKTEAGLLIKCPDAPKDGRPLGSFFYKMPKDAKSPELMNFLAVLERFIQVDTGLSPNQFGQPLKSGTTATEAAEIGGSARGRSANKLDAVERFVAGVAQDRMGLMWQHYTAADIRRLVGKESAEKWASLKRVPADVQHGMGIIIEPGSTSRQSEQMRIQQILQTLGVLNQDPMNGINVNKTELYTELLRRMGFHEASKFFFEKDGQKVAEQQAMLMAMQGGGMGPGSGGSMPAQPAATNEAQAAGMAG